MSIQSHHSRTSCYGTALQLFLTGYLHGDGDDGLQQMRWICLNKIPTRARRFKPRKITMFDLNAVINLLREEDVAQYQGSHSISVLV